MIPGYRLDALQRRSAEAAWWRATRKADGAAVWIKTVDAEFPPRARVAALQREVQLVQRLQAHAPVVRLIEAIAHGHGNLALVLEPAGQPLSAWAAEQAARGAVPLAQLLDLALALARAIGAVHTQGVVHKRLCPDNVVVLYAADGLPQVRLMDFGLASELVRERADDVLAGDLEAALPYISPEQTGRLNRDLDHRSDHYTLGVLLYELFTGHKPFNADTVLGWVHAHIGKSPRAPREVAPTLPVVLSDLLLKLLAKNAEDRYQSAHGLVEDLERCRRELAASGHIGEFTLGRRDVSAQLSVPQKLYGRQAELATLSSLLEQVRGGALELCMVAGRSGIGKSALVAELGRSLGARGGTLMQGKFDQFHRGTPFAAVAGAVRDGVRQWLLLDDAERATWRQRLQAAVAPNGQVLVEWVAEIETLLGPQPAVPVLPRAEALNRFQIALRNVLGAAASAEAPLVLFIDDLQFSDSATLGLLRWLAASRELQHLLLVGAYRSNEVDVGHPLALTLQEIGQTRTVHTLDVGPLSPAAVQQLLAETLHVDGIEAEPLARLLHDRVQGNPFFLGELLATLERTHALRFMPEAGRWRWDLEAVQRCDVSAGVVEFVLSNLRELPVATQSLLQLAACLGNRFDLRTLALTAGARSPEVARQLMPALRRHVLLPLDEGYRLAGQDIDDASINPGYAFQHDRVQQAAYALIDEARKQAVHLSIGRRLRQHAGEAHLQERLIEIVGHLNHGHVLMTDTAERLALARLNLRAAERAQRSSAYESALGYLRVGQALLPADPWRSQPLLTTQLATEVQQCAYLTGRFDEAESGLEELLARAGSDLARAELLAMRTRQYATTGKMVESIGSAIQGLSLLGLRFKAAPTATDVARERALVRQHLGDRRVAELVDAPALADPVQRMAIRLLMEIFPAAFLSGSGQLFPYLVLKAVDISLVHGHAAESAFAYAGYGMLLCGALDDPALGQQFGELAVAINERLDDIALKSRVLYVHAMFVHHWSHHWSTLTPIFRRGIETGYRSGDLLYLAYNAQDCVIWDPTLDLDRAEREHAGYLNVVRETGYQDSFDSGSLFLQMQRCLLGRTASATSLSDDSFDEQAVLAGMHARRFMTGVANFHIYKAEVCAFHGRADEAMQHVRVQDGLMASAMSLPQGVRYVLTAFLVRADLWPAQDAAGRAEFETSMRAALQRMRRWALHCEANFAHLHALMAAELSRLTGKAGKTGNCAALQHYERAMALAHQHGWRRDEALAHERAARHLLARGQRLAAVGYLRAAIKLFEGYGAVRKVALLRDEFGSSVLGDARSDAAGSGLPVAFSEQIDLASVMQAAQAISGEIVLERLWSRTLRVMLENAGAQRGCLVVRWGAGWALLGITDLEDPATDEQPAADALPLDSAEAAALVPVSIVYQVLQSQQPLLLDDARGEAHAARDAYLRRARPQSVLCLPLVQRGRLEGAVYMENRLAAGVFSEARTEVLRLLAAQVAVAIENARLVDEQARLISAQRRFVPREFLESLNRSDIARVDPGEHVAKAMSVLFADLRGFTPLAEQLGAREVIGLLNRYFTEMGRPITSAGGFIDSFAGDEIKALFNAHADSPAAAGSDAAVRGGIGMWRALEAFNTAAAQRGTPVLQMGMGVHTGPVVLGTVGGADRLQCSVLGDTVNLASRIEQLTKLYGARFLVSGDTQRALADPSAFELRRVDEVAVKGKQVAVGIWQVLDAEAAATRSARLVTRERLHDAQALYARGDFAAAQAAFEVLCAEDPDDAVPPLYVQRCLRYRHQPPPAGWAGVERLTQK